MLSNDNNIRKVATVFANYHLDSGNNEILEMPIPAHVAPRIPDAVAIRATRAPVANLYGDRPWNVRISFRGRPFVYAASASDDLFIAILAAIRNAETVQSRLNK